MMKEIIADYLTEVGSLFSGGDAREESYYLILKAFIDKTSAFLKRPDLEAMIMPKTTEIGNPDLVVKSSNYKVVGYIEAKDPKKKLDRLEDSPQIKRYLEVFPNLVLTNFLEFRFYRHGRFIDVVSIGRLDFLVKMGIEPIPGSEKKFLQLFGDYISYIFPDNLNSRGLAEELAKRTRLMRDYVVMEELKPGLESVENVDKGEVNHILGFYHAFKKYLIHDLNKKDFADLYSQTLTFGLFTAATQCKGKLSPENAVKYIPIANGILHEMFEFISMGKESGQLRGSMDDIVNVINSVNTSKILDEYFWDGKGNDPVLHFYETFLSEYDPRVREKRGVYYTPKAIVYFIVSSIHVILKEKLNRPDGLADSKIKILDPAAGTSTFLAEVARMAIDEYTKKYGEGTREDFAHHYLLNNLFGFEVMMAPYAVAYLKMAYILKKIGFSIKKKERLNIYLTNALELEDTEQANLPGMSTLSAESRGAAQVKKNTPITVVLGNPPYAGHALTRSETVISKITRTKRIKHQVVKTWIGEQIEMYKSVDGKPLQEKNLKWLQDDYVKFIRFAQVKIDENGEGVVGFVTNHAYLDNPTFRGMRQSLMKSFNEIYILDLHGNAMRKEKSPDGSIDENVFDIKQGVAISLFIKKPGEGNECKVYYSEVWGLRDDKYEQLGMNNINEIKWVRIFPTHDFFLFTSAAARESVNKVCMYRRFVRITDLFPIYSVGIVTARDKLTIKRDKKEMNKTIEKFSNMDEASARYFFDLGDDTRDWQVKEAQQDIRDSGADRKKIVPILYRPFDIRYTYYTGKSRGFLCMPRPKVMRHMFRENIALITVRQVAEGVFNHCLVADTIVESRVSTSNKGIAFIFPLYIYLYPNKNKKGLFNHCFSNEPMPEQPNIHPGILNLLRQIPGFDPLPIAEQIFYYVYAVLYSNIYRETNRGHLKIDFPRIPFTSDYDLFIEVARLGQRLAAVHLMKSKELEKTFSKFAVSGDNLVKKVRFMPVEGEDGKVYINNRQFFSNITSDIWETKICGYQLMSNWLKLRKDQRLSCKDMEYYIKIARCLRLTIRYQQEIDRLYPSIEKSLILT